MLITMAWRNLWRSKQRSLLTLSVMVFGLFVSLIVFGLGDGAHQQMVKVATSTYIGHIQLNRQGYHKEQKLHVLISQKSTPVKMLEQASKNQTKSSLEPWQRQIRAWSPRVFGSGLVSTGKNSSGGFLLGIDLGQESGVTRLPESVLKGMTRQALCKGKYSNRFPAEYYKAIRSEFKKLGGKLTSDKDFCKASKKLQRKALHTATQSFRKQKKLFAKTLTRLLRKHEVVLGKGLSTVLKAKVGQSIAVISQSLYGAPSDDKYTVVGIIESGSPDLDISLCLMPLQSLQSLLAVEGNYHTLVIRTQSEHGRKIKKLASMISASLKAKGFKAQDYAYEKSAPFKQKIPSYEVLPWQRISPELFEFIQADESAQFLMTIIVFFLIAFILLNTLQMSIVERTREFGVLMSLGMKGRKLIALVMMEGLCLGLTSVVLGLLLSLPVMGYLQTYGIPIGEPLQMGGIILELKIMGLITMQGLLFCPGVVLFTTLVVSFFPAYRVVKLKPTQALRHV